MLQLNRELSPEELDAMEAQDAAAPSSPAQPPATPLAMGPIAQLDPAREYTAEELDLYEEANSFTPDELDQKLVASVLDDPTYIPSRDEYFQAKDAKARLKSEGKLPGLLDYAATGAGAFIQTLGDMATEIVDDPGDFLARGPATGEAIKRKSWRGTNDFARWFRQLNATNPVGRYEDTGEFVYDQVGSDVVPLADHQMRALEQGRKIRPVNEEDVKDAEYERFIFERSRQKELEEWVAGVSERTHPLTRLFSERDQQEQPMQATSDILGGVLEPTNALTMAIPFGAGAKSIGFSRVAKDYGSRTARVLERSAGAGADAMEAGASRLQSIIEKGTRLSPENQTKIAKWSAAGGVGGAVFGMDTDIPVLSQAQDAAKFLGGAYIAYKGGVGTLRTVQKVAGPTSVALRIAADPADGLDAVAQASVATKLNAFPELSPVREVLENPTRFRAIESTPARIAADPRFGPQTRAIADSLANPAIVQGVRGASAVAGGAIKGAAANAPFVALALNAEEEQAAGNMLGMGAAFGAAGGAASRFTGLKQRRAEARSSDIARMLIDVELAGGDVGKFAQTYSPQQLGDLASMQGFFRDKVEFVPLNKTDFDLNTKALGGTGAAGLHVQAAPGEKARIFINLDAKREGIVPHELGHALIKSGALGGMQADSIRAFTTRRYTQAGVEARAREYATTLIQNENAAKFPGQNLAISQDAIQAKMDELGQSGLLRGDTDPLDWARDEIFAEDFRQASQSMDFAAIRRNLPAEGSWLGSMEGILGAQANALSISGVRIDPVTGQPDPLFKTNPILDTDPVLKKQVGQYLNNYRQWINHPDQTKARGVRVAPAARPQDLVNNPLVTFHDYGGGVLANEFARIDPATGQAILRDQRDINAETAKRQQQVKALVGSKLLPATDPNLGPKKTADGRVTVRGRTLPQQFDFLNGFAQHQRTFARQLETAAANGESLMVRYHSIGTGDSGSFRVRNLGNLEAITREVIPWGWELTSKGNLLTSVLDLTQFRNRALKAINAGDPTIGRLYNNDLKAIEADLKQWMENHRQDLPGSNKIGEQRRDAINSLIGIATNVNKGANPFSGKIAGPSSAIKQFRLDRLDAATGTGRTGFHFDYDKANGNLLPEIPTPLPDLSKDLPTPKGASQAEAPTIKVRFGNTGQNYSLIPPGQAIPDAYHGTPHKVDRFSTDKIGTGEGAQAYGWGLYFAENQKVAEDYQRTLAKRAGTTDAWFLRPIDSATEKFRKAINYADAAPMAISQTISAMSATEADAPRISRELAASARKPEYIKAYNDIADMIDSGEVIVSIPSGNLYSVKLNVDDADLLDWDKPLSEQSPKVQAALAEMNPDFYSPEGADYDGNERGQVTYTRLSTDFVQKQNRREVPYGNTYKQASEKLLALGIPGIRYADQGSRQFNATDERLLELAKKYNGNKEAAVDDFMRSVYDAPKAKEKMRNDLLRNFPERTYNYVVFDENLIRITEENGNRIPASQALDTPGQAMPDVVHSAGYALPKKVPQRGYFSIGTLPTTDGRVLEYHVDPTTTIQPRVAGINSIRGEQVAMLEADRHNTRGDNMGGPLHPFLISNQTVARLPDGRGYKAVWANMNSAFVTRAKNIVKTTTAGHALIQIMKENAHRSNRKFVMDVTAEIDKRSSTMSKDQVDFLHVVLELGAINPKGRMNQAASKLERTAKAALNKEVPMQELADAQKEYDATLNKYQPMVEFLSRLSPLKSHATRGRMPAFDNEFASILSNYRNQPWFESMASKYRNTKFVDEAARFSFNQRGAAMDRITGIPFAPNVKSMLKSSMDFVNGQNLDVVGVVQLSKDADAFAVYFGKNSKEEGKMSPNERLLRNQLLASGSFKPHPSYDWVMLGPENADSFILDTPADPLKLFPDYAKNHPNKNVREGSKETVVGTMKKSKIPLVLK
jgi:hypothetical protein